MNYFLDKIKNKKSKVLIIGLGYVGWPLLKTVHKKGFNVAGLDINKNLVNLYKKKNKKAELYYNYNDINFENFDILIIALPTPLKNKVPDLSYLKITMKLLYPKLKKNMLIVLESTSYPTTTDEVISSKLQKNLKLEKIFLLVIHLREKIQEIKILI
jgi:UDP-N-acetyl-D-glucosamine dehydrogenase